MMLLAFYRQMIIIFVLYQPLLQLNIVRLASAFSIPASALQELLIEDTIGK